MFLSLDQEDTVSTCTLRFRMPMWLCGIRLSTKFSDFVILNSVLGNNVFLLAFHNLSLVRIILFPALQIIQKRLGRAGEKAVDVLDTLGSRMSKLNGNSGFANGRASRGSKISMLAFEVANTIAKGASLLQSLSEENIQVLRKELANSGIQQLVSTDMKELLSFAAADKRLFLVRENILLLYAFYLPFMSRMIGFNCNSFFPFHAS